MNRFYDLVSFWGYYSLNNNFTFALITLDFPDYVMVNTKINKFSANDIWKRCQLRIRIIVRKWLKLNPQVALLGQMFYSAGIQFCSQRTNNIRSKCIYIRWNAQCSYTFTRYSNTRKMLEYRICNIRLFILINRNRTIKQGQND